jgi:hypothetical protein
MKGFVQMLEAVISIALIVSVLFLFFYPKTFQTENLYLKGYSCLKDLDNKGLLRYYAQNSLHSDLRVSLNFCLRPIVFDAVICKTVECNSEILPNKTITHITYFIAGDNTFDKAQIDLWMWLS